MARRQGRAGCQKAGREGERDGDFSRAVVAGLLGWTDWLAHSIGRARDAVRVPRPVPTPRRAGRMADRTGAERGQVRERLSK